jgi:hypothetical protein
MGESQSWSQWTLRENMLRVTCGDSIVHGCITVTLWKVESPFTSGSLQVIDSLEDIDERHTGTYRLLFALGAFG